MYNFDQRYFKFYLENNLGINGLNSVLLGACQAEPASNIFTKQVASVDEPNKNIEHPI